MISQERRNANARALGYRNYYEQRRDRESPAYKRHWQAFQDKFAPTPQQARKTRPAFEKKRVRVLRIKSNLAGGRKSDWLEGLGIREPGAGYAVGETPKRVKNEGQA